MDEALNLIMWHWREHIQDFEYTATYAMPRELWQKVHWRDEKQVSDAGRIKKAMTARSTP